MYQFTLPLPPTTNNTYRFAGKIMYKTQEAKDWEQEAGWIIKKVKRSSEPLQKSVEVSVTMYLKRDRDIDGSMKLLLDTMQRVNVYKNDKQITSLHIFKEKDPANPRLEVSVYQLD